jgi:hypothetical protein
LVFFWLSILASSYLKLLWIRRESLSECESHRMARKTLFGSKRSGLPTALSSASNNKRAASIRQFQMSKFWRPGGTKPPIFATASTKRGGYAKLQNVSSPSSYSSCSRPQQVAATLMKQGSRKREEAEGVPSNSSRRSQSSFEPAKQRVSANSELPQKSKRKSKLRRLIDRLQKSYHNLREAVRQSDLQFADLFTGNQMLMHVTAAPVSRRRSSKTMKHSPSVWHWASSTTTPKV